MLQKADWTQGGQGDSAQVPWCEWDIGALVFSSPVCTNHPQGALGHRGQEGCPSLCWGSLKEGQGVGGAGQLRGANLGKQPCLTFPFR